MLVDWALDYQRDDRQGGDGCCPAVGAARRQRPGRRFIAEPPDSRRSRDELSQRERIVRAAARVVVARGYEKLSIPTISAEAGTSHQTFYEHFRSKRDAFLAASRCWGRNACSARRQPSLPPRPGRGDRGGDRAMLECVPPMSSSPGSASSSCRPPGRRPWTVPTLWWTASPPFSPHRIHRPAPCRGVLLDAISNGIWEVIQYEIAHGGRDWTLCPTGQPR